MAGNVLHNRHVAPQHSARPVLEKAHAAEIIAASVAPLVADHGLRAVAAAAGCAPRTVQNMMGMDALPEIHRLLNLLPLSGGAVLDRLLAPYGYRLMPVDAPASGDAAMLASVAGVTSEMAAMMADGRIDRRERDRLVQAMRPVAAGMVAAIAQHDRGAG